MGISDLLEIIPVILHIFRFHGFVLRGFASYFVRVLGMVFGWSCVPGALLRHSYAPVQCISKMTDESTVNTHLVRHGAPLATFPRYGACGVHLWTFYFGLWCVCHNYNRLHIFLLASRGKPTGHCPRVEHLAMRLASIRLAIIFPSTFRTHVRTVLWRTVDHTLLSVGSV